MSILLALGAAMAYGLSDFLGGLFSRRASAWTIALVAQLVSACTLTLVALAGGGAASVTDLGWGAAAGIGSGLGTLFLYRGLAGGQMNVVAPLSAVGAAVLPVVLGFAFGERPGALAWLGIACGLPSIWLVSRSGSTTSALPGGAHAGVRDGLLAGAAFGLLFLSLGQVSESAGLWPLALGQWVAAVLLGVGAVIARAPIRTTPRGLVVGAVAVGFCAAAATVSYQLAVRGELVSVTAVLASLYPALTVVLAAMILHERMHRSQGLGLLLAAGAVALVALG